MEELNLFKLIQGVPLSSVTFVEDYAQLQVADATLTLGVLPVIQINQGFYEPGRGGYCDALRSQIGKPISSLTFEDDRKLLISFADSSVLILSKEDNPEITEMLVFEKPGDPIVVW